MRIKLRTEKYEITQKTFNYHQIQDQSNLCMTDTLEEARKQRVHEFINNHSNYQGEEYQQIESAYNEAKNKQTGSDNYQQTPKLKL